MAEDLEAQLATMHRGIWRQWRLERTPLFESATEVHYPPQTGCICGCNGSVPSGFPSRRHVEPKWLEAMTEIK